MMYSPPRGGLPSRLGRGPSAHGGGRRLFGEVVPQPRHDRSDRLALQDRAQQLEGFVGEFVEGHGHQVSLGSAVRLDAQDPARERQLLPARELRGKAHRERRFRLQGVLREQSTAVGAEIEQLGGKRTISRVPAVDRRTHRQARLFALLGPPVDAVQQQQAKRFRADARLHEEVDAELAEPDAEREEVLAVNRDPDRLARKLGQVDRVLQGQDALHGRDHHVAGIFEILADHLAAQVLELHIEVREHPADADQVTVIEQQYSGAQVQAKPPGKKARLAFRQNPRAP
jgi:hypothetical protein